MSSDDPSDAEYDETDTGSPRSDESDRDSTDEYGEFTGVNDDAEQEEEYASSGRAGSSAGEPDPGEPGPESDDFGKSGDGRLRRFLRKQFALQMENVIPEDLQRTLDQIESRLETLRESEEVQFAEKMYGRIRLAIRMVRASVEGSFALPWRSASSILLGLIYLSNPLDLLPDVVKSEDAVLDDALVVYLCYTFVEQDLRRFIRSRDLDPDDFGMETKQSLL